jgi:phospholipid/cholesterol/gamma-HCH transport system permease protein
MAGSEPYRSIEMLGGRFLGFVEETGRLGLFLLTSGLHALVPPYELAGIVAQIRFIGSRSLPVVMTAGTFIGMVVALQFHDTLVRFGSVGLLGSAVGLSLIRELAPVFTGLLVIGRAGSAICSEIGIMRAERQIDALECMAIDPYRYLVVPKLVAGIISAPLLSGVFAVCGILGGWFVGVVLFGVNQGAYFQGMYETVGAHDLAMGLVKSLLFGLLLVWICSAKGFFLHLDPKGAFGAEGVSRTTTDAVVLSSILLLFTDYLISALMI